MMSIQKRRKNPIFRRHLPPLLFLFGAIVTGVLAVPLLSGRFEAVNVIEYRSFAALSSPDSVETPPSPTPALTFEEMPAEAAPTRPGVYISGYTQLKLNDSYPAVQQLHARLTELGYLESDEPTDHYSAATADAVSLFQRACSLKITGTADSSLQEYLFGNEAVPYKARVGDSGSDIRGMQNLLRELGYYDGLVSGYFGTATQQALLAFQMKNKLSPDGEYDGDDRDLLYSDQARPAIDPTPTPRPTPKPTPKPTAKPKKATPVPAKEKEKNETGSTTPKPAAESSAGKTTPTPKPTATPAPKVDYGPEKSYGSGVSGMISCAEDQIGKAYVLGDEGPNTFDCSGLVYYCLKKAGVSVSRRNAKSYAANGAWTLVESMSDLKKGDILCFKDDKRDYVTHVGIYIGGGAMIDASSSSGKVVRRSCTTAYWTRNFVCARRVF